MQVDAFSPLAGVRVLDASRVLAGPYCGQVLGALGAEVVKVERPGAGDETRGWGPPYAGVQSAYFLSCNQHKRSITLDLAHPEGHALFLDLARASDILLENFRAASAAKLGLAPEKLLEANPRLIVCSISGFGRTGPLRDLPGYDLAIQAMSGLMSMTGPVEGPPCKVAVAVVDVLAGLHAAAAVLACLHARQRSGHGYAIDLALLDCAIASQVNVAQAYLTSGQVPPRQGNAHLQIVPYQVFPTADGWIVLAVGNDAQWRTFCALADRPDLGADERFASNRSRVEHRGILVPLVEQVLRSATTAEWEARLGSAGIPAAPVWTFAELFAQPQADERRMRVTVRDPEGRPVDLLGSPFHINGTSLPEAALPPRLGEHTDQVLRDLLHLDDARLAELRNRGII